MSDACLFFKKDTLVLIHVNDFQVFGKTEKAIHSFVKGMKKEYNIKTVETGLFLGLQVKIDKYSNISVNQTYYAKEKLKGHQIENCKSVKYPLVQMIDPLEGECTKEDFALFNRHIGELQYLANQTRPDIAHTTNHLARFLSNLGPAYLAAARHIWKYISGTIDKGLVYKKNKSGVIPIQAFSDADFAGDLSTAKSTSGLLIQIAESPIVWRSVLQKEIVLSSTEAEYLALTEATREVN